MHTFHSTIAAFLADLANHSCFRPLALSVLLFKNLSTKGNLLEMTAGLFTPAGTAPASWGALRCRAGDTAVREPTGSAGHTGYAAEHRRNLECEAHVFLQGRKVRPSSAQKDGQTCVLAQ